MRVEQVRDALGLDAQWDQRLAVLDAAGDPAQPVSLPTGEQAAEVLGRLAVLPDDTGAILAALPVIGSDPALRWLLERSVQDIRARAGTYDFIDAGPTLPQATGAPGAWFYVAVYLALVPRVLELHAARDIAPGESWAILADLGEKIAAHRARTGSGGMTTQFWFTLHERGVIFPAGRLQFNLETLPRDAGPVEAGTPAVSLHIPQWGGPFTAAAVDDALARIRPFLAAHVPEHPATVARCDSWLLDPQLVPALPATSNIAAFGRRFTLWPLSADRTEVTGDERLTSGDRSVLEFVFRRGERPLADLPRRTSLERAALERLDAGGHWHQRVGWLTLP